MKIPPVAADLFRAVAPVLGAALGGPLGGTVAAVAVKALDQWVVPRGPGAPTPEELVEAVEKNANDPQLALDLKRAELAVKDYELRMKKLDAAFDLRKLDYDDRKDARAFVRDTGSVNFTQRLGTRLLVLDGATTLLALGGAFALMAGLVRIGDPVVFGGLMGVVGAVLGRISARADTYVNFVFGSSAGSKDKTEALNGAIRDFSAALTEAETRQPQQAPVILNNVPAPAPPQTVQENGTWHQGPHGGRRWRLTPAGVVPEGEGAPMRTVGQPATIRRVWKDWGPLVAQAAAAEGVPLEIVAATIATESRGVPAARLVEPDGRQSIGLMQILPSTASDVAGREVTAAELLDPATNIALGARYIARQRRLTGYQPPLVAAAYNAGGLHPPREGDDNPWRLRSTGDHISRLCQFYGDACAVAAEDGWGRADKAA